MCGPSCGAYQTAHEDSALGLVQRFPPGLATSPLLAAALLAVTGFASALTNIPLIALVQQWIPDRHLAKAPGIWEADVAGAVAIASVIAGTTIDHAGVRAGFMLSGAALIVIGATAALNPHAAPQPLLTDSPAASAAGRCCGSKVGAREIQEDR